MRAVQTVLGVPDEIAADRTWVYDIDFEGDGLLGACVTLELYAKGGRLERAAVMRDD